MIRIGVLGTANIALRRMIPAILKRDEFEYIGVAVSSPNEWTEEVSDPEAFKAAKIKKAESFREAFGGKIYEGYEELLKDESVDAVYIPLPPSMHEYWSKKALSYNKHVLSEKPFTLTEEATKEVTSLAEEKGLACFENYGFVLHPQFSEMKRLLNAGELGEFRLMRAAFTFPFRDASDFRYKKEYGGGATLDCGGYVIKAAEEILGEDIELIDAILHKSEGYDVDIYGDAIFRNPKGQTAQLSFGMDNVYRCQLEIMGSTGSVLSDRTYTAPDSFAVELSVNKNGTNEKITLEPFDQFGAVLGAFADLIANREKRETVKEKLIRHAYLVDEVMRRIS